MKFIRREAPDKRKAEKLAHELGVSVQMASLLIMRGYTETREAEMFLRPDLSNLHDPLYLGDMDNACSRIETAISRGELICVYGDYDVDGIAACALLYNYLRSVGAEVEYYIPSRHKEGYGLNKDAIDKLRERGVRLIITVDCGISAWKEVEYIKRCGMDVIVTDHHMPPAELPACAVVNPKCAPEYPFSSLCGAGVAAKLVDALDDGNALEECLDLVALATMADVVPLTGENRIFVSEGIKRIKSGRCAVGIDRLCAVAALDRTALTSRDIAFVLAPRINAAGRMGDPSRGLELLITGDVQRADEIALELHRENEKRRGAEQEAVAQARKMIGETSDFLKERAIVIRAEGWNEGILGLVASRIVKDYGLPAVVLSGKEGGALAGSARSYGDLNLYDAISDCAPCLESFGGHKKAAGLTLKNEEFDSFKAAFMDAVEKRTTPDSFIPSYEYDLDVELKDINIEFARECMLIAPFGEGNPAPHICVKGSPQNVVKMGRDGSHLRFKLNCGCVSANVVAFGMGERAAEIKEYDNAECLVEIGMDRWQGESRLRMNLVEMIPIYDEKEEPGRWNEKLMRAFLYEIGYNNKLTSDARFIDKAELLELAIGDAHKCVSGVAFCSYGIEALLSFRERVKERMLDGVVDWNGQSHSFMRPAVCAASAPDWESLKRQGYRRIYMLDGELFSGAANAVAGAIGAEVFCSNENPRACTALKEMLKGFDRKRLGSIYSWMRGLYSAGECELLSGEVFEAHEVLAALGIFSELGLAEEKAADTYLFSAKPNEKRDLNDSTIYRALSAYAQGD